MNYKMFYRDNRIVKKVKKRNMKYLVTKKRSKYSKKVSDQRKNKKTSCKIERYTTRLHNSRKNEQIIKVWESERREILLLDQKDKRMICKMVKQNFKMHIKTYGIFQK